MIQALNGTPFTGYLSLNTGVPGPLAFAIFPVPGGAAYALGAGERIYITSVTISTNDPALDLVTIDDGFISSPTNIARAYVTITTPAYVDNFPPGIVRTAQGKTPRAGSSAITAAKTVECIIRGYISRT